MPLKSNQKTSEYLKEIAVVCGIDKNITFHIARHSFAVMFLSCGGTMESLSRILGHTNMKTTQIYAKITDDKILSEMKDVQQKLIDNNLT